MNRMYAKVSLGVLFCHAILISSSFAGTVMTLETDFGGAQSWFRVSAPSRVITAEEAGIEAPENANKSVLLLPAENAFQTPNVIFRAAYKEELEIEMLVASKDGAKASVAVVYLDPDGNKEVSRTELPEISVGPQWQLYRQRVVLQQLDKINYVSRFRVVVRTKDGSMPLFVSRFKASTHAKNLANISDDPGFEHGLNYDCWFALKGVDWDGIKYNRHLSGFKRVKENVTSGKYSLRLVGPAVTLKSKRFPYHGETLFVSTWFKLDDIRLVPEEKPAGWATSAIQVVGYDKNGKEVGHHDVVLEKGTKDWEHRYCPILFNKGVKYVEVLIRHFPGIRGTSWYDGTVILKDNTSVSSVPYNPDRGTLSVDVSKVETTPIRPIWLNTDANYLCEFGDRNYRAQMRQICDEIPMEMIRIREIMNVSPDLVQVDKDGNLVHNWKVLDDHFDFLVKDLKVRLLITPETTPDALAVKRTRAFCNRYVPRDYRLYQKALENVVCHLVERYGKATVESWYWDIWNEPTAPAFFFGSKEEFAQIVLHFYRAMMNVEKRMGVDLKLMTSSAAGVGYLLDLRTLKNADLLGEVNGISYHGYAGMKSPLSNFESLHEVCDQARKDYGLHDVEAFNTELNGNVMPDANRDTEIGAAFAIKIIRWYLDKDIDRLFWFCAACRGCEWGWGGYKPFNGAFYIIDYKRIRMPIFNSLRLLSRMIGGNRIPVKSSNEPFDAIAVQMPSGQIRVIVTTFDEDFAGSQNRPSTVRVEFKGVTKPLKCKEAFLIDKTRSIAMDDYRKMGLPKAKDLTEKKFEILRKASDLENAALPTVRKRGKVQYVELRLVGQSVWMGDFGS